MSQRKPIEIALGDKSYFIRPTTLGQAVRISEELGKQQGPIGMAIAVIAIALERDKPEDASAIGDMEATVPQITEAMGAILRLAGFSQASDAPQAA